MTLVEFLLARITEDEDVAHVERRVRDRLPEMWSDFSQRFDPAWVLAECEAKRRIIALHQPGHECSQYDHNGDIDRFMYCHDFEDCSTTKVLALPYAGHPDYQEEWRP